MTSSARIDDLQRKYQENPRRYFAPLANELRRAGEAGRAVAICETGLSADPGHLSGHVVLGQALADLGDRRGAERAFGQAVELDPENATALRSLGDLARDRGDSTAARSWYQRALETDPRDPELATRLAALDVAPPSLEAPPAGPLQTAPVSDSAHVAQEPEQPAASNDGLLDEAQLHEFQSERDAQEFTAGFFAALLEADRDQPAPPAAAAPEAASEGRPEDDESPRPTDAVEEARAVMPTAAAPAAGPVEEEPAAPQPADAARELAAPSEDERPPDVTMADETLDVGPDERAYLDDLLELDGELVGDVGAGQAAASESELSRELEIVAGAADAGPEIAFQQPANTASEIEVEVGGPEPAGDFDAALWPAPVAEEADLDDTAPSPASMAGETGHDAAARSSAPVPEEIAPEWTLVDAPQAAVPSDDELPAVEPEPVSDAAPHLSFVTVTMGTLLLQQGFRNDALQIFRQLSAQNPDDAELRARIEELEAELAPGTAGGMTVSGWLRALAGSRPASRPDSQPASAQAVAAVPEVAEGTETTSTGSAEWVEAIPEAVAGADVVSEADREEVASEQPAARGAEWVEATPASPAENDLVAGAAAAAASAVTWEATEPPAASDALFFGDDPLDWGRPAAEPASTATLEELLGGPVSTDDELAAGALAAATLAMQGDAQVDAALAEASAEDPMALENVLTPTPSGLAALRGGASFSFEQFFQPESDAGGQSGDAGTGAGAAPGSLDRSAPGASPAAERTAARTDATDSSDATAATDAEAAAREADLADFHAWLAGLSKS